MSDKRTQDSVGPQQELSFLPSCPACAQQISETAHFCPNCGTSLPGPDSDVAPAVVPKSDAPAPVRRLTLADFKDGLPDNIAGMLAYFILPAIVFLLVRPFNRNRFVRFHSIQCLLTIVVLIVLQLAIALFGKLLPLLVLSLYGLLILAELTLWLLLLFKAYEHETLKLPLVGDLAEKWAEGK